MKGRVIGSVAFAGAAVGSAALGYYAKRRAAGGAEPDATSEWAELHRPVHGDPVTVRSFDGTRLHAEVLGPDDAPTLVFAHAWSLSQHEWHYQRRDLMGPFRLVCYDQRGHGGSDEAISGDYSLSALGQDFAAVIDAVRPADAPVVAVGHSMGGMAILSFADQFPQRVTHLDGVVLVSTAAANLVAESAFSVGTAVFSAVRGAVLSRRRSRRRGPAAAPSHDPAEWPKGSPPTDVGFLVTRALGLSPEADPAHVAFTEQLVRQCPVRVKAAVGPAVTSLRFGHVVERLRVPGLVMVGDHDRLTPVSQARRLAEAMPEARLIQIPGAGHMAPLEAHAHVTAELSGFAKEVGGLSAA